MNSTPSPRVIARTSSNSECHIELPRAPDHCPQPGLLLGSRLFARFSAFSTTPAFEVECRLRLPPGHACRGHPPKCTAAGEDEGRPGNDALPDFKASAAWIAAFPPRDRLAGVQNIAKRRELHANLGKLD